MTLIRFERLKRYVYICDPTGDNGSSYFFDKMEPLWSAVREACNSCWKPGLHLSTDEMMVMNFGRSSETVKMRNKPIKSGFKVWALGDHGYTYSFFPNSNAHPWSHCTAYKNTLKYHATVVARLSDELPRDCFGADTATQYCLYMDNLFTTPALLRLLRDREIGGVGTVRSNAKNLPREIAIRGKKNTAHNWNELGSIQCENGNVLALVWIDKAPVQMLTIVHVVSHSDTVDRLRRRPRLTSTNGPRVREVFGSQARKVLAIPRIIDDYNWHMGGVDVADQLRSSFSSHIPSQRTWMPLFFWLLDTSATKSSVINRQEMEKQTS